MIEASILFALVFELTKNYLLVNIGWLSLIIFFTFSYLLFEFASFLRGYSFEKLKIINIFLLIAVVYSAIFFRVLEQRRVDGVIHDGAVLVESAVMELLSGNDPYSVSYEKYFEGYPDKPLPIVYDSFMYSPGMFLINVPFAVFKNFDLRVSLILAYIISALVLLRFVNKRALFLILFFLNPSFVKLTFYGANEAFLLMFFALAIQFLYRKKITLATTCMAIGVSLKILFLPFVIVYFVFVFNYLKGDFRKMYINILVFLGIVSLIYLPFIVLDPIEFIRDTIFFHLKEGYHQIAGFWGVPQIVERFGIVNINSNFPFYLVGLFVAIALLPIIYKIISIKPRISTFVFVSIFYFLVLLLFSRIIQTFYIAFVSELFIIGAFLRDEKLTKSRS